MSFVFCYIKSPSFLQIHVVGVTGVEPVMRESKSRALPLGYTPSFKQIQITQKIFTALSAYGVAVLRWDLNPGL